ncbi:Rieske (2Fe-2S) protein [Nitrospirillum viridazoti]|uniref:Nitrite reductase/ring-hydroxylating ferredoxin subunit n=1 Tax=Nitrospirillum amazonense TaxID=28077 RepID=A0A560HM31_9PROT|nr:Rieske (2Fe-2S) protein [Nitrospirillum amazonense]TWB47545.1 nitrite reductase/ring-hydroxylating ferredoxin subunit [Nitrospirillum amazonense]
MPEAATPLAPSPLCRLADIADGQAKGINWGSGSAREEILVARRGDRAFAYHNRCPHVGTTLDWTPDRFMSADGRHLQCATHGALFRVEDGLCIHGPCAGRSLTPVRVHVEDGAVHLDD